MSYLSMLHVILGGLAAVPALAERPPAAVNPPVAPSPAVSDTHQAQPAPLFTICQPQYKCVWEQTKCM